MYHSRILTAAKEEMRAKKGRKEDEENSFINIHLHNPNIIQAYFKMCDSFFVSFFPSSTRTIVESGAA